jgi:AraC-like DNA-binding protein
VTPVRVPRPRAFEARGSSNASVVDAWERHNAEQLIELACRLPEGSCFRGREINVHVEQLSLARVLGTAHEVTRDSAMIANRPADAIAVYVGLRGDALVECAGRRQVVHPGEILVCDVDLPFVRGFGHGLEELAVKVAKPAFAALTGLKSLTTPLVIDSASDPYARALARMVGRAVSPTMPVAPDEQSVVELVSVVATGTRAGVPHAHRAAARAFIDDHLTDPSLSATDVANGAGISERHLSRVFADAGLSVPRQILARRLDFAYSLLAHGSAPRTADVAARCGFTSMAYFSQAFKRRFGVTAGAVRRMPGGQAAGPSPHPAGQRDGRG